MKTVRVKAIAFFLIVIVYLILCKTYMQYEDMDLTTRSLNFDWNSDWFSDRSRRLFIFFGTRPEIIKLAPLIIELRESNVFLVKTVFTGQHADLIDQNLNLFNISVDIRFSSSFREGQSLAMLFGKIMLEADLLKSNKNDVWVIQGDTSSALAIAMVAFHKQIRVAHLEAGLRTFDMYAPFPEEFNRKTISSVATYNFAPTVSNAKNLINEGIDTKKIFITGNTIIDAAKYLEQLQLLKKPKILQSRQDNRLVLVTMHRRENKKYFDDFYTSISSSKCSDCLFVLPVHPNPIAKKSAMNICERDKRFYCVAPLRYEELHWLLKHVKLVISDSGGIQEEVTWYTTPLLILRNVTERVESIEAGIAFIVNTTYLSTQIDRMLYETRTLNISGKRLIFGDGTAAKQIIEILHTVNLELSQKVTLPCRINVSLSKRDAHNIWPYRMKRNNSNQSVIYITAQLKEIKHPTIAVILQVYKRNTLAKQLDFVVNQSYTPTTVVIVQNGHFINVSTVIGQFRSRFKNIEFQHIASSKNLRFHWRFHVAFMQKEDYVSVWDDDVYAKKQWLEHSIQYSQEHKFAVVGANCRIFQRIDLKANIVVQRDRTGRCDFVGHIWTLPRRYLVFFIAMNSLTTYTGEDVQLAFALQREGIEMHKPPMKDERYAGDMNFFSTDINSSWKKHQSPRTILFCRLFLLNFNVMECSNCKDKTVLQKCLDNNFSKSLQTEKKEFLTDTKDNAGFWS